MDRKIIAALLFAALMMVSCYDSFNPFVPSSDSAAVANITLEELHKLYDEGAREINQDIVVAGRVTANDEHGNLYKSIIIEQEGYALKILVGLFDSFVRYPIGSNIALRLNSLGLDRYNGVLRAGLVAPATSPYSLDYLEAEVLIDKHIALTSYGDSPTPTTRAIGELSARNAGELTRIEKLRLLNSNGIECRWSGYALFRDANLDTIWCYTSPYADFAEAIVPRDEVTLQGILTFGNCENQSEQFIIEIRGEDDCIY